MHGKREFRRKAGEVLKLVPISIIRLIARVYMMRREMAPILKLQVDG